MYCSSDLIIISLNAKTRNLVQCCLLTFTVLVSELPRNNSPSDKNKRRNYIKGNDGLLILKYDLVFTFFSHELSVIIRTYFDVASAYVSQLLCF